MKILALTQYFWPENFRINDISRSLMEKGIEVDVLTGKPNYPGGDIFEGYRAWGCRCENWEGITVCRIPIVPRGTKSPLRLAANYLSFVLSGLLLAPWLLRKKHYDAIFVYAPSPVLQAIPSIFLGRLKKCPVILWVQDLWPESLSATGYVGNPWILKAVEHVVRFIYRHTDMLLVQSEAFIGPVSALASGTPVNYYPNSVDKSFSMPPSLPAPDIPELNDGFSVMFAGNIGSAQAVETIVEAAALLKGYADIKFVVLGDGSRREWMLEEAKNRNLPNLHLPGKFPVEAMPALMQRASSLLVTLADQPIFMLTIPNKMQAYLAAGRPIIACLNGEGARLVSESGAGLSVRAEDGKALADAVLRLYGMPPKERETMGAKGRLYYAQHFSHDMLIDQLIDHLRVVSKERLR